MKDPRTPRTPVSDAGPELLESQPEEEPGRFVVDTAGTFASLGVQSCARCAGTGSEYLGVFAGSLVAASDGDTSCHGETTCILEEFRGSELDGVSLDAALRGFRFGVRWQWILSGQTTGSDRASHRRPCRAQSKMAKGLAEVVASTWMIASIRAPVDSGNRLLGGFFQLHCPSSAPRRFGKQVPNRLSEVFWGARHHGLAPTPPQAAASTVEGTHRQFLSL